MRPLIRKLLPLVGLCWIGMAIAREEIINIPCCEAEDCPIKGTIGSNDPDEVMLVSVKGILSKSGKLVELHGGYPSLEEWYQYLRALPEQLARELGNADIAGVDVYVECEARGDGRGVIDRGDEPVICRELPRARVEQNAPVCSEDEAQGVQLKVEYLNKRELMQEFSELQARKAALDQRAEELQGHIDKCDQRLNEQLFGNRGNHTSSGNSSTTETNSHENLPVNNSSASWNWKHWLKHLPVSVSSASGGELGAWQNSGVGLAE